MLLVSFVFIIGGKFVFENNILSAQEAEMHVLQNGEFETPSFQH